MKLMIDISEEDFKSIKGSSLLSSGYIPANRVFEAIKKGVEVPNIFFNPNPEYEELFSKIEDALGFKLYAWTKSYIIQGKFRCYGKTTAEILRTLVTDVGKEPIVVPPQSGMHMHERFYYRELSDIYERLNIAGIPTRNVIFRRR